MLKNGLFLSPSFGNFFIKFTTLNSPFLSKNSDFDHKIVENIFEIICILKAAKNYTSNFPGNDGERKSPFLSINSQIKHPFLLFDTYQKHTVWMPILQIFLGLKQYIISFE